MPFINEATETLHKAACEAARRNDLTLLQTLLAAGADPDILDYSGFALLHRAAQFDRLAMTRLLLEAGANPNTIGARGLTALMFAKHTEIAALLLTAGANVNAQSERSRMEEGQSALMKAAYRERLRLVRLLLAHGADPNLRDMNGDTALTLAADGNSPELIQELLAHGAESEARNKAGQSALSLAAANNAFEVARVLREAGATVGLLEATLLNDLTLMQAVLSARTSRKAKTLALYWAAGCGRLEPLRLLLAHGAEVEARVGRQKSTALMFAAEEGEIEAMTILLAHGADANARDADGNPPLFLSMESRSKANTATLALLLEAGADINQTSGMSQPGSKGKTALIEAVRNGFTDCVRLLIKHGANLEVHSAEDKKHNIGGTTALREAVWRSRLKIARLLLEAGADPNNLGLYPRSLLRSARQNTEYPIRQWKKSKRYRSAINPEFGHWVKARRNPPVPRPARRQSLQERREMIIRLLIAAGGTE